MDSLELLQWWHVILLPHVWEQYSLERPDWSEWSSKGLERKRSRVLHCLCAWAAWVCWAMALPHSFLLPFSLFFFSLFLFVFFFYLSPFFSFFFFEQARSDTFLKQGYSFGWLELAARRSTISPTLGLLCESQVCNVGVSFWVCSTPKSIKVFSWCSPHVLGHRMSLVLLNRHLKWLGPRIPEGAYYA